MDLAGHPVDPEAVGAVRGQLQLEDLIGECEQIAEGGARGNPIRVEDHDPGGVVADL